MNPQSFPPTREERTTFQLPISWGTLTPRSPCVLISRVRSEATQEKHNFPRKRTVPTSRGDVKPGASGPSEAVPGKSERQPCSVLGRKPGLHQASQDRGQLQGRVTKARS